MSHALSGVIPLSVAESISPSEWLLEQDNKPHKSWSFPTIDSLRVPLGELLKKSRLPLTAGMSRPGNHAAIGERDAGAGHADPTLRGHADPPGGKFPSEEARVLVHAKIMIYALNLAGLSAPLKKILVGDPITSLGFKISCAQHRLNIPHMKRLALLDSIGDSLREEAFTHASADRVEANRLVGRLLNITQVSPELKPFLIGGYKVIPAGWAIRARSSPVPRTGLPVITVIS